MATTGRAGHRFGVTSQDLAAGQVPDFDTQKRISRTGHWRLRLGLASNPKTDPWVLWQLQHGANRQIQEALDANPSTPKSKPEQPGTEADRQRRAEIAEYNQAQARKSPAQKRAEKEAEDRAADAEYLEDRRLGWL